MVFAAIFFFHDRTPTRIAYIGRQGEQLKLSFIALPNQKQGFQQHSYREIRSVPLREGRWVSHWIIPARRIWNETAWMFGSLDAVHFTRTQDGDQAHY